MTFRVSIKALIDYFLSGAFIQKDTDLSIDSCTVMILMTSLPANLHHIRTAVL